MVPLWHAGSRLGTVHGEQRRCARTSSSASCSNMAPRPIGATRVTNNQYFVKVATSTGVEEVWGIDLERALRESKSGVKVGDQIGIRRLGQEAVTVTLRDSTTRPAPK